MGVPSKLSVAFSSFRTAHQFIKTHRLWKYIIFPGLINIFLFYFSFNWFLDRVSDWVAGLIHIDCSDSNLWDWLCTIISFISGFLEFFVRYILYVSFIGLYLLVYKNVILIIYSPVLAYLIEVVEKKHKGIEVPFKLEQFIKDTVRGVILAGRGLLVESVVLLVLFIFLFIPIINLIQPILMWLVSAYFLGVSMIDYTLERKGYNIKKSIVYSKKHKSLAGGIGIVFQLIFMLPFFGWMIAPTYSAVAAYFAVDKLERLNENE